MIPGLGADAAVDYVPTSHVNTHIIWRKMNTRQDWVAWQKKSNDERRGKS